MFSHVDLTLWFLTTFVEAFVVCLLVVQGLFRHFLLLNLYLLLSVTSSLGQYVVGSHFGLASFGFYYFYWFTDALLETCLFFSVCQLSAHVVGNKMFQKKIVWLSLGGFLATAWLSFSVASSSSGIRDATHFASELSRNISLFSCLVIIALWAWKVHNNPNDWIADRLVKVLTVYFLLFFLAFGARQMAPHVSAPMYVSWMVYAWLPIGCGFAVSQEHPQSQ
jgi:hypothetical protein